MVEMNQGRGGAFGKELLTIDLGAGNRRLSLARPQFWNGIRALSLRIGSYSEQGLLSGRLASAHIAVGFHHARHLHQLIWVNLPRRLHD